MLRTCVILLTKLSHSGFVDLIYKNFFYKCFFFSESKHNHTINETDYYSLADFTVKLSKKIGIRCFDGRSFSVCHKALFSVDTSLHGDIILAVRSSNSP